MYTVGRYRLRFHRPVLMGIVNVTPDSFSDGGRFLDPLAAIAQGKRLVEEGADWLDIGGESSRPGAVPVGTREELKRVIPVIEGLAPLGVPLAIDTVHPEVAEAALTAGAVIVNDIAGGRDPRMIAVAARHRAPYIAMHMQGEPRTMQANPTYEDVTAEVFAWLGERLAALERGGVTQVITDVGIGFGKNLAHNLLLMKQLDWFLELGHPILIGPSRKSWIAKALGVEVPMPERLEPTIAACVMCLERGARVFRVHEVAPVKRALQAAWGILIADQVPENGPVPWPAVVGPQ